jgi:hypothetical protein
MKSSLYIKMIYEKNQVIFTRFVVMWVLGSGSKNIIIIEMTQDKKFSINCNIVAMTKERLNITRGVVDIGYYMQLTDCTIIVVG